MGTWHLEVARMIAYIAFPVGLFHWFNQPDVFKEYVEKLREEYGMQDSPELRKKYNDFVDEINREKELEVLKAMEDKYMK